ncbi:MAG TPA: thermonuclease family protein [Candidatus Moranbacteria bacterium]|nr:thermonuclease family protein [Candidatus Moranbacteria bacterium]
MSAVESKKSKIIIIIGVFLLGIAIGFGIGFEFGRENRVTKPLDNSQAKKDVYVGEYKVLRVIDGDTIEIEGGERVRYIGIDTPEVGANGKADECYAQKAKEKNQELVLGKNVELRKDVSDRDQYGRLLRYVFVDGLSINIELVRLGLAKVASFPPDVRYQDEITSAQSEAREKKSGLWVACPQE